MSKPNKKQEKQTNAIVSRATNILVAKNFIKSYGKEQFRNFLTLLQNGTMSGQKIADDMRVSRERVRQWKKCFGKEEHFFHPKPLVIEVLKNGQSVIDTFGKDKPITDLEKTIKNFVKKRGISALRDFVHKLTEVDSGEEIGKDMGFSRQWVKELKHVFGTSSRIYTIYPEIQSIRQQR